MILENLKTRIALCILASSLLVSTNLGQTVLGQNSTSTDIPDSMQQQVSSQENFGEEKSDTGNGDDKPSDPYNSTATTTTPTEGDASSTAQNANSTDVGSQKTSNDNASELQNSTSTNSSPSEAETSMQSQNSTDTQNNENTYQSPPLNSTDSSDQGQQSGNGTSTAQTYDGAQNQNSTSNGSSVDDVMDSIQPNNTTYVGNQTEITSEDESSVYGNNTQTINGNNNKNATTTISISTASSNQNATTISSLSPDYDIDVKPSMSVNAGSYATYTITITSLEGFNSNVSLAITSKSIPGIIASLSSNVTKPPTNASSTLFLNVQSDPTMQSGKHKLKVTASSANMTEKTVSVTLEVIGKNTTLDQVEQFDPIAMTPVLIKDIQDNIIDTITSGRMILISTTMNNNYNKTQPFTVVIEVRDKIQETTLYLQLQKGILNPLGEAEVAISWIPEKAGMYQIHIFAIDEIKKDSEPLSAPIGKSVEIE